MATVDTAVRFNKFNSLKLEHGETSWSQKFEVGLYSAVTVQAQVLCLDGAASGQFIMRWLDEDGKKVIDSTDGFSITNKWAKKTATFEVPEGAVKCIFALKNTDSTKEINVACAMAEAGEIASAFDPSLASQVSLLNAQGLYTGIVSANQVIAGILQSLDGKAYFDLEKPEIVMRGGDATWKASPDNPLRLEDEEGELIAGIVKIDGNIVFVTNTIGDPEDLGHHLKISKRFGEEDYTTNLDIYSEGQVVGHISTFESNWGPVVMIGAGEFEEYNIGVSISTDGVYLFSEGFNFGLYDEFAYLMSKDWKNGFGVDSGGPYRVKNGTTAYLP
ncbi:MAG: hypothetical protein WC145_12110 [Aliarcobacter sp.]